MRDDTSLLAQFFYADESLNLVAAELDSFDGRKDPERCSLLVNHLRQCQDKVLNICNRIMDELIPNERADRDFRVKFPDDVMQDNLAGQLWFGAECLAAGSSIMNREMESGAMRPIARALTRSLENVRNLLREASLRSHPPTELAHDRLIESLKMFDALLANFELSYVSAMVPVKTVYEYQLQQDVVVLFSETLQRALRLRLLNQEMVDQYDPALMFTIPRLAIVSGLLVYPVGPLSLDSGPNNMSEMFRPFWTLLVKIRELLRTLTEAELLSLERMLCSSGDPITLPHNPLTTSEADLSEEDSSCCVGDGDISESCTVMEKVPSINADLVPSTLSSQANNSGNRTLQSASSDSPGSEKSPEITESTTTPEEIERTLELEEDAVSEGASSSNFAQSGVFSLNGQWMLPLTPCACSVDLSDDTTMTKQGLVNRSLQQDIDTLEHSCEECMRQASDIDSSGTEVPSKSRLGAESSEDVRWPGGTDCPGTSNGNEQTERKNCILYGDSDSVNSVQSNSDIINSDNVNYKQMVSLNDSNLAGLRTIEGVRKVEAWKQKVQSGEASEDLHVRYTENWDALCSSGQLPKNCDKIQSSDPMSGSLSSSFSSCHSTFTATSDSMTSETSSFNSDYQDTMEVALALQAVQQAAKDEARAKFRSSGDLLHRLFVCISGVADQLQTNFAGDLRHILKSVFMINSTDSQSPEEPEPEEEVPPEDIPQDLCENGEEALLWGANSHNLVEQGNVEAAPLWLPDEAAPSCMSCQAVFTVIRRRHHCRNCGKVFCARCSSNSVPLPRYGHVKPVRVCNRCFIYHVTPFSVESIVTN